jgi:ribosomal-protein-alanine N-acetyltransferase
MREVTIRTVSREDLERVYDIEKESFEDPYPPAFISFLYDADKKTFLVAEKDRIVVGYIIASAEKDRGHIISIAIYPSERRKEIGRALMGEVLKILEAIGVATVRLEVRKSNIEAQRFYELLGFKYSHDLDKYYGDEDALVYYKSL